MKALVAGRRVVGLAFLVLSAVISLLVPHTSHSAKQSARRLVPADAKTAARVSTGYGQLPIRFEANRGQFDRAVNFVARGGGYSLALKSDEAWVQLRAAENHDTTQQRAVVSEAEVSRLKLKLENANRHARSIGLEPLAARSNYFIGRDPKAWRTNVANFARVKYEAVYPGIDLVWYGNQQQLEHDFIVAPGADPKLIRFSFAGARNIARNAQGDLTLNLNGGELRLLKPVAWQEDAGNRRTIPCEYRLRGDGRVEFELGDYDRNRTLVIDPILLYSTFVGGSSSETGRGIVVDQDGSAYVVGETFSADFPLLNPIQSKPATNFSPDAFVFKLNPAGSALVYATYLGGDFTELAYSAAVDAERNLYLTGYTFSTNFPTTANALQKEYRGNGDAFVAKLNPTGSALVYSSYLGGDGQDIATSIAVNANGEAFVSGYTDSRGLPATGFQKERSGNSIYKTEDRAGQWRAGDNGLTTRIVYQFAFDPNDSRTIYAATSSGIFKSTDGGGAWQRTGFLSATQAVAVDPSNPKTLFAATESGVYKSTDGGITWQQKQNGLTEFSYYSVLIDRQTPATIYVGSSRGVFKSTNGGENWTPANTGFSQPTPFPQPPSVRIDYLVSDAAGPQIIYAGTSQGVFKTLNGAGQWFAANNGLGSFPGTIRALVTDPATPGTLYAALSSITSSIFKSTDGGNSWTPSGPNSTLGTVPFPTIVASLAIDPTTTTTLYAGTQIEGVFKSTDGGATWNLSSNGLKNNYVRALAVDRANPATVYAGILGGPDGFVAKFNAAGNGLAYLTYLGGTESDFAVGLAIDKDGSAYVTGETNSSDFPIANALQAARSGFASDAFVTKLDPNGATLLYSTYLGGINTDSAEKIAVDAAGSAYITGTTQSGNFPLRNAAQRSFGGFSSDAFITKLNPAGSALEYSTFFGGQSTDVGRAIAVDGAGNAVIAGATTSPDFPTLDSVLPNPKASTDADAFIVRLDASGAVSYSTLLGGLLTDQAYGVAVDVAGNAYVTGSTISRDFPVVEPLQPFRNSGEVFVSKLGFESDLAVTMTASRNSVLAGASLRYTITVTNQGPSPAAGVTVTDVLPANVGFVSATTSQGACTNNAGTVTCNVGKLAAQASATITLTVMPTVAGALANTARAQGNEPDKFPNNNQATAQITVSASPSIAGRITDA
ncbi:MAG TPA: SBBP repeat-containing protein, partial [Blastocatellia bacterium]|nr:SBBP repeat-containing protein [Blastocatellia bacterium]